MNLQELKNILSTSFDLDVWKNILLNILGDKIEYFIAPQNIIGENIIGGGHIGSVRLDDGKTLGIIDIEVDDNIIIKRNRKALRGMVKDYIDQQKIHALLVFFHNRNQDDYRVSYIVKQTYFTPEGEFIKHESEPKRYTFLLGKNESCTTAALRLSDLIKKRREGSLYMLDLTEAFSVEKLNKEFFDKYVKHYRNFCEDIINNDNCRVKEFGIADKQDFKHDDNKSIRDYVKKMMGRLVFLYFLQKRGWMNGDYSYLHNLYKTKTEFHNDYLEQILEPLFFWVLNTKEDKRIPKEIANLGDVSGIPYLNGGLFEKDRLDFKVVVFKKSLFDDLFEFFSQYNFTIDENDPYDAEVGIDPEMLGHIFENLLEDNKDKGAFYTPKEIVQYMCKQSLVEYLKSKNQSKEWDAYILKLIDKHILDESVQNNVDFIDTITKLLTDVKICDPAIGSGAFPMGMLNELFHCRQILHGFTRNAKAFAPAIIKREIIQNNIYGVDIEQGAVDIARLRFWLSLIVDADEPAPLPNFDYKIVCGNSLITTFDGNPIDLKKRYLGENARRIPKKKKELFDLQSKFYNLSGAEKLAQEVEIKKCLLEIVELQLNFKLEVIKDSEVITKSLFEEFDPKVKKSTAPTYINAQIAKLRRIKTSLLSALPLEERSKIEIPLFDWEIIFSDIFNAEDKENRGFDIVIGNPPYIQLQANGGVLADQLKDGGYETFVRSGDIYCIFYEKGVQLLCNGGIETYITSNKWMRAAYGEKIRAYFAKNNPLTLVDLGSGVFESATVDTNILILQKGKNTNQLQAASVKEQLKSLGNITYSPMSIYGGDIWTILLPIEQEIKHQIESVGAPLKGWNIDINYGIKTGYNEAFIISTEKRDEILSACTTEAERIRTEGLIKPILRGKDIKRFSAAWANLWLINTHNGLKNKLAPINIIDYPAVKSHLDCNIDKLTIRADKGNTPYNLRNCAYLDEFAKEKIIFQEMVQESCFAYDNGTGTFCVDTGRIITGENIKYLAAILNSKLFFYGMKHFYAGGGLGDKGVRMKHTFMNDFPIPMPTTQSEYIMNTLVDYIVYLKETKSVSDLVSNDFVANYFEEIIDGCVYELYFEEHMKEKGLTILETVEQMIKPISQISDTKTKGEAIWAVFNSIKKTDNPIRTRLGLYATTSEILAAIITTK